MDDKNSLESRRRRNRRASLQWGKKRASYRKIKIVIPTSRQLQIDCDGLRAFQKFAELYRMLRENGHAKGWIAKWKNSTSRGHAHITITMPRKKSLAHRIALQALLGSDLKRELFNWMRAERGSRLPVLFFEKNENEKRNAR